MDKKSNTDVIIDSGASEHLIRDVGYLTEVERVPTIDVSLANGTKVQSTHRGMMKVKVAADQAVSCRAYYIPTMNLNIFS